MQMPIQQPKQPAVEEVRSLMNRLASAKNPQAALMQVLQNNPNAKTIFAMLQSGNSLESIARQMAQT